MGVIVMLCRSAPTGGFKKCEMGALVRCFRSMLESGA